MGVIRVEHNEHYTVMSNEHLRDPRLSLRAMGLMSRMLSDSDNYQHSIAGLAAVCREGRDAVRKALQELEEAGYLVREQTRKGGSFSACDYTLYEHSRRPREEERIATASVRTGLAMTKEEGGGDSPLTENPSTVNPTTGNPTTVNPTQRSTRREEVPREEPPYSPPGGGTAEGCEERITTAVCALPRHDGDGGGPPRASAPTMNGGRQAAVPTEDGGPPRASAPTEGRTRRRREPKEAPDWKPERFEKFWQLYPRGEAKQAAIRAWDALKADDELLIVMGRALLSQMASREWTEGVGVPYASTWLNQRRWTDTSKTPALPAVPEGRRDIGWI